MRNMTMTDSINRRLQAGPRWPLAAMPALVTTTAIAISMAASSAAADDPGVLQIRANSAIVSVAPAGSGRRPLRLPSLSFSFELLHECAPTFAPASLSVAIADSRRSLGRATLAEAEGLARIEMDVPSSQLPPLIVSDFCTAGEAANDTVLSERVMTGVLSASASLRCENETESHTTYAVAPLDVSLVCETQTAETE